jgi:Na+/proline symporter
VASLLGGFLTVLLLWGLGFAGFGKQGLTGPAAERFAPLYLFDLDPLVYGLLVSFAVGIVVSLFTASLPSKHVDHYFLASERSP